MKLLAAVFGIAMAAGASYELDLGASLESGRLKVQPTISGPAGKVVRYEFKVQREGRGKSGGTRMAGRVKLDDTGRARLATSNVNVGPQDRYTVTVRVQDGDEVVAEKSAQYP